MSEEREALLTLHGLKTFVTEVKNYITTKLTANNVTYSHSSHADITNTEQGLNYIINKVDATPHTYYGTCTTAAGTAAKVVSVSDTYFKIAIGTMICIKFSNNNTASNATISVNKSTALPIKRYGDTALESTCSWIAGATVQFICDGSNWIMLDGYTIPIILGGTSATDAVTARTNLGVTQSGKLVVDGTTYTLRTGTTGAAGYITFVK